MSTMNNPFSKFFEKERKRLLPLSSLTPLFECSRRTPESVNPQNVQFKIGVKDRREAEATEGLRIHNLKALKLRDIRPYETVRRITSLYFRRLENLDLECRLWKERDHSLLNISATSLPIIVQL